MAAVNRFYSSNAMRTTITSTITSTATTITVGATTGFPGSVPFTLVLDEGQVLEEIVTVTAVAGTTLTVVRGVDGTTGVTHSTGCNVVHAMTARDLREPQEHIAATTSVHGLPTVVVGATDVQTLTNKTLTSPTLNSPTVTLPITTDTTILLYGVNSNGSYTQNIRRWTTLGPRVAGELVVRSSSANPAGLVSVNLPANVLGLGGTQGSAVGSGLWNAAGGGSVAIVGWADAGTSKAIIHGPSGPINVTGSVGDSVWLNFSYLVS